MNVTLILHATLTSLSLTSEKAKVSSNSSTLPSNGVGHRPLGSTTSDTLHSVHSLTSIHCYLRFPTNTTFCSLFLSVVFISFLHFHTSCFIYTYIRQIGCHYQNLTSHIQHLLFAPFLLFWSPAYHKTFLVFSGFLPSL